MAAGTVTISEEIFGTVKKITFAWTAGTDAETGTASGTTTESYSGEIKRLVTIPSGAPDAPSDNYDIIIKDEDGADVLMSGGADRDTANTEQVNAASLGIVANDKLTFAVAAAGSGKKGTAILYIR